MTRKKKLHMSCNFKIIALELRGWNVVLLIFVYGSIWPFARCLIDLLLCGPRVAHSAPHLHRGRVSKAQATIIFACLQTHNAETSVLFRLRGCPFEGSLFHHTSEFFFISLFIFPFFQHILPIDWLLLRVFFVFFFSLFIYHVETLWEVY